MKNIIKRIFTLIEALPFPNIRDPLFKVLQELEEAIDKREMVHSPDEYEEMQRKSKLDQLQLDIDTLKESFDELTILRKNDGIVYEQEISKHKESYERIHGEATGALIREKEYLATIEAIYKTLGCIESRKTLWTWLHSLTSKKKS